MSEEPQMSQKERKIVTVTILSIVALMALVVYFVKTFVDSPFAIYVTVVAAIVVGLLLFYLVIMVIDLYRRGGEAKRALRRIREGNTTDQFRGIEMLRFIGESAVFHIKSVQQGSRGGSVGFFLVWQAQRELDKYVLPGLRIATKNVNANVRYCAVEALQKIGTWEALSIVNDVYGGDEAAE